MTKEDQLRLLKVGRGQMMNKQQLLTLQQVNDLAINAVVPK